MKTSSILRDSLCESIIDMVKIQAEENGDEIAVYTKKDSINYRELIERASIIAGYMKTIGIKKGDFVILEAVSDISYVLTYLAIQIVGAISSPVERGVQLEKLEYEISLVGAVYYFSRNDNRIKSAPTMHYDELLAEANDWNLPLEYERPLLSDIREVIFTTGTTGKSKATLHSTLNIETNTVNTVKGIGIKSSDIVLIPLPLNHSFGMRVLRAVFSVGGAVVLRSGAVFSSAIIENIRKFNCTAMASVSATMESVIREIGEEMVSKEFSSLRYIEFSAGAVSVPLRKKLLKLLPNTRLFNTWGSSESGGCVFMEFSKRSDKINALGVPINGIRLGIWSDEKNDFLKGCGKEKIGRLAIKGNMIFSGYLHEDNKYKESVDKGWMKTADLVWRDDENFYYILGRADDIINVGGEKVAQRELEDIASLIPGIEDCACIGVEDKSGLLGHIPVLYYTGSVEIDEEAAKGVFVKKIGNMLMPREYIRIEEIPRNYMKKKDYKALKKIYDGNN